MPVVSIILPTYNRAATLTRAIRSVLAQTFRDFELIVVDDGSDDDIRTLIQGMVDPRLRYLPTAGHTGAAATRNFGVQAARGDWIAFQDSDDEWLIDKLRLQVQASNPSGKSAPGLICGGYIILPRFGSPAYQRPHPRMQAGDWQADNIYDFSFIAPTWLIKKSVFETVGGFDTRMPNLEDWEFVFRLFKYPQFSIIALDEPLVVKQGSADSINPVKESRLASLQQIVERHADIWAKQPRVLARFYDEIARLHCQLGSVHDGRQNFRRALALDASSGKRWLHWLVASLSWRIYQLLANRAGRR